LLLLAIMLSACGSASLRAPIYDHFERGAFAGALEAIPESSDPLLNALDQGAIEQARGDLTASNRAFQVAEDLFEENYTKSVSREAATWTLTPTALPYQGEDFERILVHAMSALNYVELGELDEALVECRALNTRLTALQEQRADFAHYGEDAFARYLSGLIYEMSGDQTAAWIDLRRAYMIYNGQDYSRTYGMRAPPLLAADLRRLALSLGREEELAELGIEPVRPPAAIPKTYGEVVIVIGVGMAPRKVEDSVVILTADEIPIKIAIPRFVPRRTPCPSLHVQTSDGRFIAPALVVEDVGAIAEQDLADRLDREYLRMASRATAKYLAAHTARRKGGRFWGFVAGMLGVSIENADLRSWRTLPLEFRMARILLPAGAYELEALCTDTHRATSLGTVVVSAGDRVLSYTRLVR
jgi:hypothetical protein